MVVPIITYGAAIWGTMEYPEINTIHNRACTFFLGLGNFSPNAAAQGDMGWPLPLFHQWTSVIRLVGRMFNMRVDRLNRRVFDYCRRKSSGKCRNWFYRVSNFLKSNNLLHLVNQNNVPKYNTRAAVLAIQDVINAICQSKWQEAVNRPDARRAGGQNKLRTYM